MTPQFKNKIKQIIPNQLKVFISDCIYAHKKKVYEYKIIREWRKKGSILPPPHILKVKYVTKTAKKHRCTCLVETGTFLGDMVAAQINNFITIYTIELSFDLYKKAVRRFSDENKIKLIHGDSSEKLFSIVTEIPENTLFWLDGHYSGGITAKGLKISPILDELKIIFNAKKECIILIDDFRLFGTKGYPTYNELTEYVKKLNRDYSIEVYLDFIKIILK